MQKNNNERMNERKRKRERERKREIKNDAPLFSLKRMTAAFRQRIKAKITATKNK